jgi:hypothetical protein
MLTITNVKVYDLKESVIASRNAMRLIPPEYTEEEFNKSLPRAMQLAKCGGGSGHSNFRKGIRVSFDIKYPNYISPELQRYGFVDIVSSSSKMHRLMEMDLDFACNKYVPQVFIDEMRKLVDRYKCIKDCPEYHRTTFTLRDDTQIVTRNKQDALYYAFMQCISACPQGIELFMRCSTNYEQLATIYRQRRHHKLKEDWQLGFCRDFIEKLPYAHELIICDTNEGTS